MAEWVIDVKGLSKAFVGKTVVDQVGLQVSRGDIYEFLGPNGSGKTTTIRMLCGLLVPDAGTGTCLGFDVMTQSALIKLKTGYMTQKFTLYADLTVRENLDFMARMFAVADRKARVQAAIERLGIGQQRQQQLAGSLSGGWKQRLALAAATIHEPELLLLDEPTAGVDPKARREFWDEIHRLSKQGVTTLISTHYMDEAERCNKIAYIAYGKLLVNGTVQSVIDSVGLQTVACTAPHFSEITSLAQQLRAAYPALQIAQFGQQLHISAPRDFKLQEVFADLSVQYKLEPIATSLEDVFIHLMQLQKDNFA